MIDIQTQDDLFRLISKYIKKNISCYCFGGTAMMYYGYKDVTKDIDILFETKEERDEFIEAIESLGYKKISLKGIYSQNRIGDENKPIMYSRGDERFDIFLKSIFSIKLTENMKNKIFARHDFIDKNTLYVNVLSKEDIIFLKSATEREKDFEDILTIINMERTIDWDYIMQNAISQKENTNSWIILDLEKTMQRLREHTLIKKKYFDILYDALD